MLEWSIEGFQMVVDWCATTFKIESWAFYSFEDFRDLHMFKSLDPGGDEGITF
jgi:hypothetical protein